MAVILFYSVTSIFFERLKEIKEEEKRDLLNRILNNTMFVVIDLNDNDDEQKIFDTLNTSGVRLTAAEVIKNALFKRYLELDSREGAVSFYENTWEKTFLKDENSLNYWSTERSTGRLKRDNIEILLHCVGVIEGFFDPDKHSLSDLSKLYKKRINSFTSKAELEDFIRKIIGYAEIYRENFQEFDRDCTFSFNEDIKRLLHILEELEISTFHPFILFVFNKYKGKHDRIISLLHKLERFVVLNALAKLENVKNYNRLCKQFIENEGNLDNALSKITKDNVRKGLENISNKVAKLILFWIELKRRYKDDKYDEKDLKYNFSLEHIMPIKWQEKWNFEVVPHPNELLSQEKKRQDRDSKVRWIGNMTLLKSKLNSSLSNESFRVKMLGDDTRKGIVEYATLSITVDDIVKPFREGDDKWDESKIEKRTEKLLEELLEIWELSDNHNPVSSGGIF